MSPIALSWFPEFDGYGYLNQLAEVVRVPPERIAYYRVDVPAVIELLVSPLLGSAKFSPVQFIDNVLWETGDVRIDGRSKRVPMWFARRINDPAEWEKVRAFARDRPAAGLRIILTSTPSDRLPERPPGGHVIIPALDVLAHGAGRRDRPSHTRRARRASIHQQPKPDLAFGRLLLAFRARQRISIPGIEAAGRHLPARRSIRGRHTSLLDGECSRNRRL